MRSSLAFSGWTRPRLQAELLRSKYYAEGANADTWTLNLCLSFVELRGLATWGGEVAVAENGIRVRDYVVPSHIFLDTIQPS